MSEFRNVTRGADGTRYRCQRVGLDHASHWADECPDEPAKSENTESYNGWANRETWALNLLLSNDEGLCNMTRERVAAHMADDASWPDWFPAQGDPKVIRARVAGEAVQALWDEITDPDEGLLGDAELLSMVREVGSLWRVNWDEIGAAWLDNGS